MHMGIFHRYHMRQVLGSVLLTVSLSLPWASPAGATIFWDDELESGTGSPFGYLVQIGVASYDTSVKVSGNASMRFYYPPECMIVGDTNPCGGFSMRSHTPTADKYARWYMRLDGAFQVHSVETKLPRSLTSGIHQNQWTFKWGTPLLSDLVLQVPPGNAYQVYSGFTLSPNRWYCIETHEKLNTPGVNDGLIEAWVDGQLVMSHTLGQRQPGDNSLYNQQELFRQAASGYLWYDRFAVGDQRIGCSSSTPKGDTTPPASPTGLAVR